MKSGGGCATLRKWFMDGNILSEAELELYEEEGIEE